MRAALASDDLILHYQPIVDLCTGRLVEREALLRWQREDGLIGPNQFLDVAAEAGMLVEIGEHVLDLACAQVAAWRAADPPISRCE